MRFAMLAAVMAMCAAGAAAQPAVVRTERGALRLENVPDTPPGVTARLARYVNVESATFADWLPDGGMLILKRAGDTVQLHRLARPMAAPTQLTFDEERVVDASIRPRSNDIMFMRDAGGDEQFAGFVLDQRNGELRRFTAPETRNESFIWSDDGRQIAWSNVPTSRANFDVFVGEPSSAAEGRRVLGIEGAVFPLDFSDDGQKLLLQRSVSVAESQLFVQDAATRRTTRITPNSSAAYVGGEFTPDGRSVITTSDENSEFARLVRIDLTTGERFALSREQWGVEAFDLARGGATVAYVVNEGGRSRLKLMDVRSRVELPGPTLPAGVISDLQFDARGERLGFTLNSATAPADVYSWNIRAQRLTRWTRSGAIVANAVEPELISWRAPDGREISGFLYTPSTPGPHPVIINIHGGPERQFRPTYSSAIQYWVNELGVAVVAPNVRGSDGYGKTFLALDNGARREDSVRDVGALLDWIAANPSLDAKHVIVYGGSYGGYMVLAAMTHYDDRLAGAVDIVGISNFVTFLESPTGYRRDLRRLEYGDERDPETREMLERISPLTNINRITKPMFVIAGYNDPRVPYTEGEQVTTAIRRNGGEVWFMMGMNEGHGFQRRENQQAQREAETLFFQRVLNLN